MYAFEYGESIQEARNFVNSFLGNGRCGPFSVDRASQGDRDVRRSDVRHQAVLCFFVRRKKEMRDGDPNLGSSFLLRHLFKIFFC